MLCSLSDSFGKSPTSPSSSKVGLILKIVMNHTENVDIALRHYKPPSTIGCTRCRYFKSLLKSFNSFNFADTVRLYGMTAWPDFGNNFVWIFLLFSIHNQLFGADHRITGKQQHVQQVRVSVQTYTPIWITQTTLVAIHDVMCCIFRGMFSNLQGQSKLTAMSLIERSHMSPHFVFQCPFLVREIKEVTSRKWRFFILLSAFESCIATRQY